MNIVSRLLTYSLTSLLIVWTATPVVFAQQSQQEVVDRMYENEYTIYDTVWQYWWVRQVTRGEISKFMLRFAEAEGKAKIRTTEECQFNDLEWYDFTLVPTIIAACEYGIIRGFEWNYMPNNPVTEAEFITMMVRILLGDQEETWTPRREGYYDVAVRSDIINANDKSVWDLDTPALRGTVGTWLYKGALVNSDELKQEWKEDLKRVLNEIFGEMNW
jgi:hypothetical protein